MLHLKTYKIFESNIEEMILDVKDICLELQDDGFEVDVETGVYHQGKKGRKDQCILIKIRKFYFTLKEISEVILRLENWSIQYGYKIIIGDGVKFYHQVYYLQIIIYEK